MANKGTVWAFDLERASIGDLPSARWGEGGRRSDEVDANLHDKFLHKASSRTSADFVENKKGADRLREAPYGSHRSYLAAKAAWLFPTIDTARLVLIQQMDSTEKIKGLKLSLAPVQELRLMASLLSSRQFELLATAGFDLGTIRTISSLSVNYGLHT